MNAGNAWGRSARVALAVAAILAGALRGAGQENGTAASKPPPVVPNSECMDCHEAEFKARRKGQPKEWVGVRPEQYAASIHGQLACVECHTTITEATHEPDLPPVNCASCHDKTASTHAFHPRLALSPVPEGKDTSCVACHGTHETVAVKSADFAFAPKQQPKSCGECHEAAAKDYLASAHALNGHKRERQVPDCLSCHREPIAGKEAQPSIVALKLAQNKLCESCHVEKPEVAGEAAMGAKFVANFEQSVHGAALREGKGEAASCVDCHGAHQMNRAAVAGAHVNRTEISDTCAKCHEKEAGEFKSSAHALALEKGNLDSASCTSCHGEHDIKLHTDPGSPVHKKNLAQQVCADCHSSVRLTKKYGLSSDIFRTFTDSYHGLAVRGGAVEVVNCASCHGAHAIKTQNDPTSSIHPTNLARTCGECHPGANTRFALGRVHANEADKEQAPILYWIANIYVLLIVVVIGGMTIHNGLDFYRKTRRKLDMQKGLIEEPHVAHRLYLRMTTNERLQHAVLGLSFTGLVVSGFMLRYPEAWWVVGIRNLSSSAFELRGLTHRFTGVMMIAVSVWHVIYITCSPHGRKLFLDILPRWRDVTDPWKVLKFNLGLSPDKPQFPRFCYIEKAEYWAMIWGTILMTLTGFVLWFDNTSMGYLGKLGFDIARSIHFYEAVLATLAIIVWHFYFVIFNPDVYPMNLAWLTGRMSEREMMDEHPLQLEEMKAEEAKKSAAEVSASVESQTRREKEKG
jgi:cytochrome b subunit of formate dehydrogenase